MNFTSEQVILMQNLAIGYFLGISIALVGKNYIQIKKENKNLKY